jgi:hypothetical protein
MFCETTPWYDTYVTYVSYHEIVFKVQYSLIVLSKSLGRVLLKTLNFSSLEALFKTNILYCIAYTTSYIYKIRRREKSTNLKKRVQLKILCRKNTNFALFPSYDAEYPMFL